MCVGARIQVFFGGVADDLVIHIGNVHHVLELVSALPQEAAQQVHHDKSAEVADVPVVVDRGTAGVHADELVFGGLEGLRLAGERIKQLQRHKRRKIKTNL